jgi:nucleoside-diphosphate-sugar epimerase
VTNFFVDRALAGATLTVYEPGTQSRNFVHVKDVAGAYVRSAERMLEQLAAGETGVEKYEIASDEDPSVMTLAEWVADIAAEERGIDADIERIENPRGNETLVEDFDVDTGRTREQLDWQVDHSVAESIRDLLRG